MLEKLNNEIKEIISLKTLGDKRRLGVLKMIKSEIDRDVVGAKKKVDVTPIFIDKIIRPLFSLNKDMIEKGAKREDGKTFIQISNEEKEARLYENKIYSEFLVPELSKLEIEQMVLDMKSSNIKINHPKQYVKLVQSRAELGGKYASKDTINEIIEVE